jgi:nitronate monooxygenase/enoyl-[acyl-carrier protein] reductase II
MLAATWLSQHALRERIRRVRQSTDRPFGVNLVLDSPVAEQLEEPAT